ncbi:MAG: hypothetical protein NTZ52_05835, partial [Chlamydiae bacterium]|nr:hypothetical protein [Chlamydiota bacterium]
DDQITNLTVTAGAGAFTFTKIGATAAKLDAVNLTAASYSQDPELDDNVFAVSLNFTNGTIDYINAGTYNISSSQTYNLPIILLGNVILNVYPCPGEIGSGIIFNQSVNSEVGTNHTLTINACLNSVTFNGIVGDQNTSLGSITIDKASDLDIQAPMTAESLIQTDGTGTTIVNSILTAAGSSGISLRTHEVQATTSIISHGPVFIQADSAVLGGSIATFDDQVTLNTPVTLLSAFSVDTLDIIGADITFGSTLNGAFNLTLTAGARDISFSKSVGEVNPLYDVQIVLARNITASKAFSASSITQVMGTGTTSFLGNLMVSSSVGIDLTGAAFDFSSNITTLSPLVFFTVNNSSQLTVAENTTFNLSGSFIQNGNGACSMQGDLTAAVAISFESPINLIGDLSLTSSTASIDLGSGVEGGFSLTMNANQGTVTISSPIALSQPLHNLDISALNITIPQVGSETSILTGSLSLNGVNALTLQGDTYAAYAQSYNSASPIHLDHPTFFISNGGPIAFPTDLVLSSDVSMVTNGGSVTFLEISGTTGNENITCITDPQIPQFSSMDSARNRVVSTQSGLITLGTISNIGTLDVRGQEIVFAGTISCTRPIFIARNSIMNESAPVAITSVDDAFFLALAGDIGSLASPILIHSSKQIVAGGAALACFDGSSESGTVRVYEPNPPCVVYFNGVQIKNCHGPAPQPNPVNSVIYVNPRLFAVVGVYDSQFTLANNYYFTTQFLSDRLINKPVPVFVLSALDATTSVQSHKNLNRSIMRAA